MTESHTSAAETRRYLLQEASLLLLISYLLLFASTHNGLVDPTFLAITAGLLTLGVVALLWKSRPLPASVEWPWLVFGAVLLLSCLTSIDPRRSLTEFWLLGAAGLVWILVACLVQRGWPAELIIKALLIVGAILMIFAWLEPLQWYMQSVAAMGNWLPSLNYRLSLPNFFGVILNLMLMVAAARLLATRQMASRVFLSLWILSALGLLYLTSSRGGWLGTAAGLACLGVLAFRNFRSRWLPLWEWLWRRRALLSLLAVIALAVAYLLYRQAMQPTHGSLFGSRAEFWGPAWNAFLQSPLLGKGPYTFISLYLQANSVPPKLLFVYAHNIYLDVLSGSGILGLVAFLWLVVAITRALWGAIRTGGEAGVVAMGALAAWAAFLVHGLADSVHHTIPTSAWTLAIILGASVTARPLGVSGRRVNGTLVLGLGVAALSWANLWLALPLYRGVAEANSGEWSQAAAQLAEAARRDPKLAIAHQQSGLAEAVLASQGEAPALDVALGAFEQTVALDPYWALNHANLGALYRQKGDLPTARQAFQQAVALAPDAALYYLNLGEVEEALGNTIAAQQAYTTALRLQPDWQAAYFWRATALRQALVQKLAATASPSLATLAELEAQLQSDRSRARAYLQLGRAYLEAGRVQEAGQVLQQGGLAYFSDDEEHLEWAWLVAEQAAASGELDQAVALGQQALDDYRRQGVYGPGSYGKLMYAPLMFRRPEMALELVPQMTVITLPDRWGEHMHQLSVWYTALGEADKAQALEKELRIVIPDFYEAVQPNSTA